MSGSGRLLVPSAPLPTWFSVVAGTSVSMVATGEADRPVADPGAALWPSALTTTSATTIAITTTTLPPTITILGRLSARRAAACCAAIRSRATCCPTPPALLMAVWPYLWSAGVSGSDQAGDRVGRLFDLAGGGIAALGDGLHDAVAEVFLEQAERDGLQGLGGRGDLGEDVDAVLVFIDHSLQAADLPFDAAQPLDVAVLVVGVSVHCPAPWRSMSCADGCVPIFQPTHWPRSRGPAGHLDLGRALASWLAGVIRTSRTGSAR